MNGDDLGTLLLILINVAIFGLAIALAIYLHFRADEFLSRWAAESGYEIVQKERRYLRRGPFFFRTSRGQAVFYVTVRDRQWRERTGYVRLGTWLLGMLQYNADVEWVEPDR